MEFVQKQCAEPFGFFDKQKILDNQKLREYLIYSLTGVVLFEYLALTFKFSPRIANDELYSSVYLGSYLILFLSGALTGFRIKEGQWAPIRFLGSTISEKLNEIIGCEITITSYSGGKKEDEFLPNQGTIVSRLVVSGEPDWYLVKINKPCEMEYFMRDYILIRAKVKSQPVEMVNPDQPPY